MSRPKQLTRSLVLSAIVAAAGVASTAAILHAKGISFALTDSYFIIGPAHAEESMNGMAQAAALSTNLTVTVDGKTMTFSIAELGPDNFPQRTVKVHNEHTNADEIYVGPTLGDVLARAGFVADKPTQREMLRSYVQAEGTDKYWVLYSLTEIEPSEHEGDVIVATAMDGKPLGADGALKLVSSEDKKPQRWVRNLAAITVKAAE